MVRPYLKKKRGSGERKLPAVATAFESNKQLYNTLVLLIIWNHGVKNTTFISILEVVFRKRHTHTALTKSKLAVWQIFLGETTQTHF